VCSLFKITISASLWVYFLTVETQKVSETYYSSYELTQLVAREEITRISSSDIFPEGNFCKGVNNITWARINNSLNGTTVA
jgi:hypothetical protein